MIINITLLLYSIRDVRCLRHTNIEQMAVNGVLRTVASRNTGHLGEHLQHMPMLKASLTVVIAKNKI
jgi:hypothetical protein